MDSIKVGTFNVAASLQPNITELQEWLEKQLLDVVCLQEVDEYTGRNPYSMMSYFNQIYPYAYFSEAIPFENGRFGNGILSRFPLDNKTSTFFENFGVEKRVYQRVVMTVGKKKIVIYNTHLSFESKQIRRQQVTELMTAINQEPEAAVLLLGDFNMDQGLEEWSSFEGLNLVNGYNNQWYKTFNHHDPNMKVYSIDNILTSKNILIEEVAIQQTNLSDHSLLSCKIGLL